MKYNNPLPISKKIEENYELIKNMIGIDVSFDTGYREILVKNVKVQIYYVTGLCDTGYIIRLIRELLYLGEDDVILNKQSFEIVGNHIAANQVEITDDINKLVKAVLSGLIGIIVENNNKAYIVDVRNYPGRQPEEPETEKVVKGSRDGFTENIIINTGLLRRRIRDPELRNEIFQVGKYSKTDVCLCYIKGISDEKLVNKIRKKIQNVEVDELIMADKQLEELIVNQRFNPYPKVRYTERPDILATHLYQGQVGIMVDTSPSVIIAPTTYFELLQHVEEYRQTPIVGSYLRIIRTGGVLTSLFLVPLWMLLVYHPELLPENLAFIGPKEKGSIPIIVQVILGEIGVEFLRMAGIHTPTALSNALGILAGILIGQIAIDVGLFSPEVILYISVSIIGTYATPSYELGLANKIGKLCIIILTYFLGLYGFLGGVAFYFIYLAFNTSFGKPYLYPLIPFNFKEFLNIFIRVDQNFKKQKDQTN